MKYAILILLVYITIIDILKNTKGKYLMYLHLYLIGNMYTLYSFPLLPIPLYWASGFMIIVLAGDKSSNIYNNKVFLISILYGLYVAISFTVSHFDADMRVITSLLSIPLFAMTGLIIANTRNSFNYLSFLIIISSIVVITQNIYKFIPILSMLHLENLHELTAPHYQLGLAASRLGILFAVIIAGNSQLYRVLGSIGLLMSYVITFISGARAQTLGLVLATLYILRKRLITLLLFAGIMLMLFGIIPKVADTNFALERYQRILTKGGLTASSEYQFREEQREYAIEHILNKPILGYGYDSWFINRGAVTSKRIVTSLGPHNGYLLMLYELGVLCTLLFFIAVIYGIKGFYQNRYNNTKVLACMIVLLYLIVGAVHGVLAKYHILWLYIAVMSIRLNTSKIE